jgi:hypothetical protein
MQVLNATNRLLDFVEFSKKEPKNVKKKHFLPNKEGSVVMQVQNASDRLLVFVGLFGVLWDVALRRLLYWTLLLEGKLGV